VQIEMKGYRDYRGVPVFGAWVWDGELGMGLTSEVDVPLCQDSCRVHIIVEEE